jgi:hypothetical protein
MLKMFLNVRLSIQEDALVNTYGKELFKVTVDAGDMFKRLSTNFIVKNFLESFLKSVNRPLDFPLYVGDQKYSKMICSNRLLLQGIYTMTNVTMSDQFCPVAANIKGMAEVRVTGKISGKKRMVLLFLLKLYGYKASEKLILLLNLHFVSISLGYDEIISYIIQ